MTPNELTQIAEKIANQIAPEEYCFLYMQWACMPRSDWSSWVQAIGSIAAIVASVAVVLWQQGAQRRVALSAALKAEMETINSLVEILKHFKLSVESAVSTYRAGQQITDQMTWAYTHALSAMRETPDTVVQGALIITIKEGKVGMENAVAGINRLLQCVRFGTQTDEAADLRRIDDGLESVRICAGNLEGRCKQIQAELEAMGKVHT